MSNYNPVYKTIWTSQKFEKLDSSEKLIFLYLLTNDRTIQTGIYQILLKQIACDCDLPILIVEKAFKKFIDVGLIYHWSNENIVYICNYFKFARGMIKNPNMLAKTIKRQTELLKKPEIWQIFFKDYKEIIDSINNSLMNSQTNKSKNSNGNNDIDNNKNINENNLNDKFIPLEEILNNDRH